MASPRRPRTQVGSSGDVQVRLPPIKSLQLAHTTTEESVYPTPLSAAWPTTQQFTRTTPLVPTTVDPAATNAPYPTPISARPHLPHRTSSASTPSYSSSYPNSSSSSYTPHTPTAFQPSSFHYVPPTTAESTTSTNSSGRNPPFVDDSKFPHDRTAPSAFTQEPRLPFGHDRSTSGTGYANTPERQRYSNDIRYHDPRYQESRYQSQDPRYTNDPRYPQPTPQPRDPQQPDDRSVYTPAEARAAAFQSSPDIRTAYPPQPDNRTTYPQDPRYPQDTRPGYTPDPRYHPPDPRYPQDARAAYPPEARNTYTQDPRYDARGYDPRGYSTSEIDARAYVAPPQDARSVYPSQDTRPAFPQDARAAYTAPAQDARPAYAPQPQESRAYVPPPQPQQPQPQAQPQAQDTRYTPGQEPRNTYPPPAPPQTQPYAPPAQQQPPAQDARTYAPPPERSYSHTDVRGYASSERAQHQHQQMSYHPPPDARAVEQRPSVLDPQPQPQPQSREQRGTASDARVVEPRAVEVRPALLQRQSGDARSGLETQRGMEQGRQTVMETQGRQTMESQRQTMESQRQTMESQRQTMESQRQTMESQRQTVMETQRQTVMESQARPTMMESQARPTMMESQVRPAMLESQARPMALESQARPMALESQPRPPVMLEGPARSTGFVSQSQPQSQGSQRVVSGGGGERMGKDEVIREIVQHCTALYKFANHYGAFFVSYFISFLIFRFFPLTHLHSQPPNFQPTPPTPRRRTRRNDSSRRRSRPSPRRPQKRHTHFPLIPPLLHKRTPLPPLRAPPLPRSNNRHERSQKRELKHRNGDHGRGRA
ncbi:hypothetical protein DFH29DRAFT_635729 [Suillus ampliporus]|nr:hypothetical protein DFH29DRAFT_635729 [Suillus ampliporus]